MRYVVWVGCMFLMAACAPSIPPAEARTEMARTLDDVRPEIDELGVEAYRDLDWCSNIVYERGAFSSDPENATCNLFQGSAIAFDPQAALDFQALRVRLQGLALPITAIRRREPSSTDLGRLEFTLEDGGTMIYSPGYALPSADPGEELPLAIDPNWYFMWEDWN